LGESRIVSPPQPELVTNGLTQKTQDVSDPGAASLGRECQRCDHPVRDRIADASPLGLETHSEGDTLMQRPFKSASEGRHGLALMQGRLNCCLR
jgi:hypothetical protein